MKFAVWVPPEYRDDAGVDDEKCWVRSNLGDYVTIDERGIWNTRKMAEKAIVEDWEEVIEIEDET